MKASRIVLALVVLFVLGGLLYAGGRIALRLAHSARKPDERISDQPYKEITGAKTQPAQDKPAPAAPAAPAAPGKPDENATAAIDDYTPATVGAIRLSDDAANKQGGFWLEQPFSIGTEIAQDGAPLFKLFAGLDAQTKSALAVTLSGGTLALELNAGNDGAKREVARVKLPKLAPGQYDLGLLWRNNELGVWIGNLEILTWQPGPDKPLAAKLLALNSAFQALAPGVKTGPRRALSFDAIRFDDNFMRQSANANGEWKPVSGHWELTATTFAERSANPFSLRASFKDMPPFEEDPLNAPEKRVRDGEYGIGVQISFSEGTPHIVRITGGGPAAHAGLAEDDVFIKVNGHEVSRMPNYFLYRELNGAPGDINLVMYRPGEQTLREVTVHPQGFKWGVNVEGFALPPVRETSNGPAGDYALIVAGEEGWSDYEAEAAVKPLGAGGMGLAVAVTSDNDYLLFRWLGPHERNQPARKQENVLQLVRVKEGKETVLAEKIARYRPYEFYRMGVIWRDGKFTGLIDKNELLSASVPDVKRGKIGLWALKGNAVFFDDVHVAGDRAVTAGWRTAERSLNAIFALEDDMEVWANPALEWERSVKTGWAIHNQRFPGEQALSLVKPRFKELNVALHCGDDPESAACPRLTIKDGIAELIGEGLERQRAEVGAGPFQKIGMDAGAFGVRASIDGHKLAANWIGTKPHLAGALATGAGERLAIRGLKNLGDPAAVRVTSSGTLEYTFDNAPSDWKISSGRWGLLNKWICDPRWSWFGGRTKTVGAVWNKHIFSGDVSLDAHVALMMMRDDPPFERPGDFNLAFCGDGENLDSGYTLIFGGDINSWTRLYRKGVQVAEATDERFRVTSDRIRHPDKQDLHQRWFHLKLEKIGNTIAFYRDGALAFKFADPDPLPDGRAAFWTLDNGFLLSRLRIAHGGARPAPFEAGRCELFEDAKVINMFDGEIPTAVAAEALPADIAKVLNAPPDESAYRVTNGIGGGPFALQFKSKTFNMEQQSVLQFAYRIEPGAKVDLNLIQLGYADFNPRHQAAYRWHMSGPRPEIGGTLADEFAPLVGDVPNVVADGQWHVAQFDLQPSWREFWKRRGGLNRSQLVARIMFGNLDNTGYLLAGMNGNHAGAVYAVSDVRMSASTAGEIAELAPPTIARVKPALQPNAPLIHATSGSNAEPEFLPPDGALSLTDVTTQGLQNVRVQQSDEAPPWAATGQKRSIEAIGTGELTSMGFALRRVQYDTRRWPYLDLEYKVPLETPFNLLMRTNSLPDVLMANENDASMPHALILTDLEDARDHLSQQIQSRFGPPKDFVADNTWRRSTVPLLKLFSNANPGADPLKISSLSFEDRGWKGGRRGLHWWLHRIQPVPAGRLQDLKFSWSAENNLAADDFESSVDANPEGDPSGKHELKSGAPLSDSSVASALKDGWNYVHVRFKNGASKNLWSETAHRKFYLDTSPPRVARTEPPDGGKLAGQTLKIFLDEEHGVRLAGASLKIDGDNMTAFCEYDPKENAIVFNALNAGAPFVPGVPGATVHIELNGLSDNFGNTQKTPYSFKFVCDARPGAKGPDMASVHYAAPTEFPQTYRQYDMELSYGLDFEAYTGHVHAIRDCKMEWLNDAALAYSGKRALRFTSLQDDGDIQIMLHKNAWVIDRLPLLHFDYRVDPGFNVDLGLEAFGILHSIKFTGSGRAPNVPGGLALGAFGDVRADGQWHHASVDLRALLDSAGAKMPARIVNKIVFTAHGEDGCKRGATLSIDNLDMASAGGSGPRGGYGQLKFKARESAAGLGGFSYVVDQIPETIPPETVKDRSGEVSLQIRYGVWYAHVRACDQAGNWGATQTIRLDFGERTRQNTYRNVEEN